MVALLAACRPTPPPASVGAVKLYVDADGLYQVSAADLRAAGFDLAGADPATLTLSTGGEPVAFQMVDAGREKALRFYGQALGPEAYLSRNVYWLQRLPAGATPVESLQVTRADASLTDDTAAVTVVTVTVRAEEQKLYRVQAAALADRWVWQTLFAPVTVTLPLQAPHAVASEVYPEQSRRGYPEQSQSATIRVRVIGNSSAPVNPDHHLVLSLNGAAVADFTWDGLGPVVISGTVPAAALAPGENRLALFAPGDTGAAADSVALDWVELDYPRALVMDGGELAFGGDAAAYALRVGGELAALWDVTDPARPIALDGAALTDGVLRFRSEGGSRRFLAVTAAGLRAPAAIVPAAGPDLHDWPGGADLIIVTVPEFRTALAPLVAARQAQGLRVAVVDVAQVYDSFSHGRVEPEAIRALVQHATTHWPAPAPRFLLLAGDASYDPRGYLAGTERDLVPTRAVRTTFSGWTGSDVWYALPDDDPASLPAVAVGRFPAQTAEQLATMVAKTLDYERTLTEDWRSRSLLVADNKEPGFAVEADDFAATLTSYTTRVVTLEGDGSAAREVLLAAFDQGTGLIGYFGHGSVQLWAQEKIFGVEDVAKLANRERLPVLFTVTCLSGFFEHPTTPSLGETLLRARNGGAVAALVPSSAALLIDQRVLSQGLAAALAPSAESVPRTLGEAVLQAQSGLTAAGGVREILLTFNLLGDPTLPR